MADRKCLIFLLKLQKMNKTRSENIYKFYCTSDPTTWETNEANEHDMHKIVTDVNPDRRDCYEIAGARGRLGGGKRGEGGGML